MDTQPEAVTETCDDRHAQICARDVMGRICDIKRRLESVQAFDASEAITLQAEDADLSAGTWGEAYLALVEVEAAAVALVQGRGC